MKFTKMSLVAALLVGSSAFAVDNIKVSGDAQVVYSANNDTENGYAKYKKEDQTLLYKDSSSADAALHLGITADLLKNDLVSVSAGAKTTVLATLGLENNFVSNVFGGAHTATTNTNATYASKETTGAKVENASWFNEAYTVVSSGKTALKVGRQELDTPLAFTEKWSVEQNSFEAAVLINQDIPDTTVVAAYVGNGNGTETFGQNAQSNVQALGLASGAVVNGNGKFTTYGENGAYALGVINNAYKPLTVQAWYYDVTKLAQAYWLQADLDATDLGVAGLFAGLQYSSINLEGGSVTVKAVRAEAGSTATSDISAGVIAARIGYKIKDLVCAKFAYSSTSKDHSVGFNTATAMTTAQSKLYTEAWWNYGVVTQKDTTAMNLSVKSPVQGIFDLGVYYTSADQATKSGDNDMSELALTAGKTLGPVDTTLAYVYTDKKQAADPVTTVQAYVTVNF